ncbi:MAG TPA: hypothetical protein VFK03_01025 [Candidatus Saccharimonadales bacterium]|nr:hypothetical protein [Candidatus Saccharimonadales bacterium]
MPDEKPTPTTEDTSVITGGQPGGSTHRRRTVLIVLAIVVLAALAGYAAYRVYDHYRDNQAATAKLQQQAEALGDSYDYSGFSTDDVAVKLQAVGLDWQAAREGNLSNLNFDQAYAVARALRVDEKYDRSLEAYAVAQAQVPADANYTFYKGYAEVALFANKTDLWKDEMKRQKQAIEQDDSLNDDTKKTFTDDIDEAIRLKDLGW